MRLTITSKEPKTGERRQIEEEDDNEKMRKKEKDTYDEKENEMKKLLAAGSGRRKFGTMIARQSTKSKPTGLLWRISLLETQ